MEDFLERVLPGTNSRESQHISIKLGDPMNKEIFQGT